ncbi:MAG: NAD(P)-binding domain-containing protein [Candidatus Korobacteraceae bacterium]
MLRRLQFFARTIVIATGAYYNKPTAVALDRFVGRGVHFGATHIESQLCEGEEVIVVGGGNSAGQAAVFLSQTARRVYMLVRAADLAESMSRYLIQRIVGNPSIELLYRSGRRNVAITGGARRTLGSARD